MTFIATVIGKRGAAVIADSLVTTKIPTIEWRDFIDFLDKEGKKDPSSDIKLSPGDIMGLFKSRPSYTKDYEEKLFKFDDYTAITTAGSASINGKRIGVLIRDIVEINKSDKNYNRKKIKTKVKNFCLELEKDIKAHIQSQNSISRTRFIVTHFEKKSRKTIAYKLDVNPSDKKDLLDTTYEFIRIDLANDYEKVISNGQNRISERILYGSLDDVYRLIPRLALRIFEDFKIPEDKIPKDYIDKLRSDRTVVSPKLFEEMQIFKLSELSLQQAVDLASLLMRIEIDFQTYTENIPTVGGVIKVATLNENGFKFVSGHEVTKPNNIK